MNLNIYEFFFVNNKVFCLDLEIKLGEICYKLLLKFDRLCNNCFFNGLEENKYLKFKIEINIFGKNISIVSWINCIDGEYNCFIECIDFFLYKNK